jgi:hypothetical protein
MFVFLRASTGEGESEGNLVLSFLVGSMFTAHMVASQTYIGLTDYERAVDASLYFFDAQRSGPVEPGTFRNPLTGLCLDVFNPSVMIHNCTGHTNQQWKVSSGGRLANPASGNCLDVNYSSNSVQAVSCTGAANQAWDFEQSDNARNGRVVNPSTGLCLTVRDCETGCTPMTEVYAAKCDWNLLPESQFWSASHRVPWRSDSGMADGSRVGLDLTGGFYDGSALVKFNFPMAASTTTLAWSAIEFKAGYESSGNWDNLLSTLRWSLDYMLKCHSGNNLYAQVGSTLEDTLEWKRPEDMAQGFLSLLPLISHFLSLSLSLSPVSLPFHDV